MCRTKKRHRWHGQRRGKVQRSAVVGHDHRAVRDRGCQLQDVAVVAIDRKLAVPFRNRFGLLPLAGTRQENDRIPTLSQTLGELTVGLIAPMLRPAVKSAGVEAEYRSIEADAERAKTLECALARVDRQPDARNLIDY